MSVEVHEEARLSGSEADALRRDYERIVSKELKPHPLLIIPSFDDMLTMGVDAWLKTIREYKDICKKEKEDPLSFGWENPIWSVPDALLGFGWSDEDDVRGEYIREGLGFSGPVDSLMINGGNRSSKTEYACKRIVRNLVRFPDYTVYCFDAKHQKSLGQQEKIHHFLPSKYKRVFIREQNAYLSYKRHTGFAGQRFILDNRSDTFFWNYVMDVGSWEGPEIDFVWFDELVTNPWMEAAPYRLATREGKCLVTFTPKDGYTPVVESFWKQAEVVVSRRAYLLPLDGGQMDLGRALFRDSWENWLKVKVEGEDFKGRVFEVMPRVLKCRPIQMEDWEEYTRAIVCFWPSDNPYGNPRSVLKKVLSASSSAIKIRWYGKAEKLSSVAFSGFDEKVHVVDPELIPGPDEGTTYMMVDIAERRNCFITWIRATADAHYVFMEWPGNYAIPGIGFLGKWTLLGSKKGGERGPAQKSLGFGIAQYKYEIARLEGWKDLEMLERDKFDSWKDWVYGLNERHGADFQVCARLFDSRFAGSPRIESASQVTMLEKFIDSGLCGCDAARGSSNVKEGIKLIEDLLVWDKEAPLNRFNQPRLYFSRNCTNTIDAMNFFTGEGGEDEASKDPVDNLIYYVLSDCRFVPGFSGWMSQGVAKRVGWYGPKY